MSTTSPTRFTLDLLTWSPWLERATGQAARAVVGQPRITSWRSVVKMPSLARSSSQRTTAASNRESVTSGIGFALLPLLDGTDQPIE